jgi:hypothetical protein
MLISVPALLSAIVSQLFSTPDLSSLNLWLLEADDIRSAKNSDEIISVGLGYLITKLQGMQKLLSERPFLYKWVCCYAVYSLFKCSSVR